MDSNFDFTTLFWYPAHYHNPTVESIVKCSDLVLCHSIESELYFRICGMNAQFLSLPFYSLKTNTRHGNIPKKILYFDAFEGENSQPWHAVLVLREILNSFPNAKLIILGDFKSAKCRKDFESKIAENRLTGRVIITGKNFEAEKLLKNGGVLISTSLFGGYRESINQGLAHGLHCVVYDTSSLYGRDCPGMHVVPQGDYHAAGKIIQEIFASSESSNEKDGIYTTAIGSDITDYCQQFLKVLNSFHRYSIYHNYSHNDFAKILNYASLYSGYKL